MKRAPKLLIAVIGLTVSAVEMPAQAPTRKKPQVVPGEIVVKYKSEVSLAAVMATLQSGGVAEIKSYPDVPFVVGKIAPGKNLDEVLNACRAQPNVEYAEPNYRVYALEPPQDPTNFPNDSRFAELWNLHQANDNDIDAPEAWTVTTGSREVIVAIIDTGIDYNHDDLKDNIWYNPGESGDKAKNKVDDDGNGYVDDFRGWNFVFNNKDPYDDHGHGTHVAGTVGAAGNNRTGVAGVNWQVKLMAVKFIGSNGEGTTADAAAAIIYATNNGAKIFNNSWGGDGFSQTLENAIKYAYDHGVLFIAAAGNDGENNDRLPHYPSNYEVPNVVAVASSDNRDKLSSFSNCGRHTVDIAAPGSNILSTKPLGRYERLSGTSMATPHVAGVCALVWAKYPDLSPHQVLIRVLGSAEQKLDFIYRMTTGGRLNAARALSTNPVIAFTTDWSYTADEAGPYPVSTAVLDDDSVTSVRLTYTLNGSVTDSLEMTAASQDSFTASIPGQPLHTVIEYAVAATDNDGNRTTGPTYKFKITAESDPRDKPVGCCGKRAVTVQGLDESAQLALEIPLNIVFFLLPIMLLRRRKYFQMPEQS
jgi:subtilisin family serine protease